MAYEADFMLPRLGDGDSGGRVVKWHKLPGESFARKDVLLEVETDKALVEVPAHADGVMVKHLVDVDATVAYRDPIAQVKFDGVAPPAPRVESASDQPPGTDGPDRDPEPEQTRAGDGAGNGTAARAAGSRHARQPGIRSDTGGDGTRVVATPWARTLARERRVDLSTITGSGKNGRVVGHDVTGHDPRSASLASRATDRSARDVIFDVEERRVDTPEGSLFARIWNPQERRVAATAVLLHGLFGDVDTWAAQAVALARRGIRVVAVDLPCHGQSTVATTELQAIVATLVAALKSLTDEPLALVGHSYGGAVAARVASARSFELHSLSLLSPAGLGTTIDQSFLDGMVHARTGEALAREMRKLGDTLSPPGETLLKETLARLESRTEALALLCATLARAGVQQIDILGDIEAIATESAVRIVQGKRDRILPWMQVLDAPPRASLHLVGKAGHMPHWEASALTTALLLDTMGARS